MTIADTLRQLGLPAPDPRSDGELLSRFVRARDETAFAELFRRHGPTVYGVCRRVVGTGPDADDAFQAVFLVLTRKAGTVRPPGMIGNWLYGVAVRTANKARVMNAKKANRRCEPPGGLDQHPAVHSTGSPDRDTLAVIDAELAALPDVYRAAFVACDLNGRSRSEAARELGWPEGTVAARVAKARELLAARLRKRGVTFGVGLFAAVAVPTATATETLVAVQELLAVGTANAVAPAAQSLSDEVMQSMTTIHAKWLAVVGVLTLTLATGGAILLAGEPNKTPVRELIKAPVPKVAEAVWKEETPIEFKDNGRVTSIAFAPSGKTFAVCRANGLIDFYDPATRKHQQSMNFLGDPKANPKREGGTHPAIAFRPRPHAKLGDVFAVTHKNGVNFGTTNIGLLVDDPPAVDDVPANWVMKGFDPHQVIWPGDESVAATDGAKVEWRNRLTGQNDKLDYNWELAGGTRGHPTIFTALPEQDRLFVTNASVFSDTNMIQVAKAPPVGSTRDQQLSGHNTRPVTGAVSTDGNRIVSADEKGTLIVWERKDAKFEEKHRVELGEGVTQLALAPNGKTVAVLRAFVDTELLGRSKRVLTTLHLYVFDVTLPPENPKPHWTTGKSPLLGEKKSTGPFSLAFSPDGTTLLAAFGDPYPGVDRGLDGADPEAKSLGVRVWTLGEGKIKAPVPKVAGDGILWVGSYDLEASPKSMRLFGYTPDGRKAHDLELGIDPRDPGQLFGITPDGGSILFSAKDGKQSAELTKDLTLHVRPLDPSAKPRDTGIPLSRNGDTVVPSPDGKLIVRNRYEKTDTSRSGLVAEVFDLTTGKQTDHKLPADTHISSWSPDGKCLYGVWLDPVEPPKMVVRKTRVVKILLTSGDPETVFEEVPVYGFGAVSPDGKTWLGSGYSPWNPNKPDTAMKVVRYDPASKEVVGLASDERMSSGGAVWSLDGKRVAYIARLGDRDPQHGIRTKNPQLKLVVCDPDGENAKTVLNEKGAASESLIFFGWRPNPPAAEAPEKVKAPVPKPVETEWKEGKAIELKDGARVTAVTFSPDGNTVVVGQKSDVIAIDAKTRQEQHVILKIKDAEDQIFRIRYKPDGTRLGIANRNSYGLAGTEPKIGTADYATWAGQMTNVAFSSDGARFAASDGRTVKVHSLRKQKETPEPLQFVPHTTAEDGKGDIPSAIAFSPKGDHLLLLPNVRVPTDWQFDPKLGLKVGDLKACTHWVAAVWSLEGEELKVLKHDKARLTVADWSEDGQHIVTGDEQGTLFIWDGKTFKEKARLNLGQGLVQLAIAPNGQTVAALRTVRSRPESELDQTDFELFVFDLTDPPAKPKPLWKTEKPFSWGFAGPASLAFSPDGKTLLAAFADPYHDVTSGGKTPKSSGIRVWELVPKK